MRPECMVGFATIRESSNDLVCDTDQQDQLPYVRLASTVGVYQVWSRNERSATMDTHPLPDWSPERAVRDMMSS